MCVSEGGMRPLVPSHCPQPLALLINDCWNDSYLRRPSFKTILERLSAMIRDCNSLDIASSLTWSTKLNQVSLKTESGLNVSPQEDINNKHPTRIITTEISNVIHQALISLGQILFEGEWECKQQSHQEEN